LIIDWILKFIFWIVGNITISHVYKNCISPNPSPYVMKTCDSIKKIEINTNYIYPYVGCDGNVCTPGTIDYNVFLKNGEVITTTIQNSILRLIYDKGLNEFTKLKKKIRIRLSFRFEMNEFFVFFF
jgi:hypothetical protein